MTPTRNATPVTLEEWGAELADCTQMLNCELKHNGRTSVTFEFLSVITVPVVNEAGELVKLEHELQTIELKIPVWTFLLFGWTGGHDGLFERCERRILGEVKRHKDGAA